MNAQSDMTKVMDRIRKLQAMSGSANENEAAAFAEKVQALLAEFNLSMSDIPDAEEASVDESIVIDAGDTTTSLPWRRPLALAVARMYFCEYFYTTIPSRKQAIDIHNFVGAAYNVAVAKIMFKYLHETIDRLAKEGALKVPPKQRSPYRTTFRGVAAKRVCIRIAQRMEEGKRGEVKTESGSNLPALLDLYQSWEQRNKAHMDKEVGDLKVTTRRPAILHDAAIVDGRKAGDSIGLDQQVGSDKSKRIGSSKND